MNKKAQLGTAWFILAAVFGVFLLVWGGIGLWGVLRFITAPLGSMGPLGIFFIALIIILILRRQ